MQSTLENKIHVAAIMDGNGRWATRQGLDRQEGHRAGLQTLRRIVEAAPEQGVGTLTVYAFSSDNWRRPKKEVSGLIALLRIYLYWDMPRLVQNGVCLEVIGRRDRFPRDVQDAIERAETLTKDGKKLCLRIALDYSARDAIAAAAARASSPEDFTREGFSKLLRDGSQAPDVDLLIRTGGEQRLSDFLLWEAAYAEFYFTERMWPDFDKSDLAGAIKAFANRQRRFGGLKPNVAA